MTAKQNVSNLPLEAKKIGRPKGSASGAREVSFLLTHYEKKITERVSSPKGWTREDIDDKFTTEFATNLFVDKHSVNLTL